MTRQKKLTFLAAGLIVLIGAALRIAAARGDLWLDEISTLTLVAGMHNPFAAFLMAHDNNHILNSIYLYYVGPAATPLVQRGFSIALGIVTVAVSGLVLADRGRGAALLAMGLFAISLPLVNYGSEARGYAGLIFCTLLAIHYLDKQLRDGGQRWKLALTIFFGMLFHLTMAASALALALYVFIDRWYATGTIKKSVTQTAWIFAPSLLFIVPLAIDILIAVTTAEHPFLFGAVTAFSGLGFIVGYGGMIMAMLGVLSRFSSIFGIIIAVVFACLCFFWRRPGDKRPGIYLVFLIALPLAVFICQISNTVISRYFLPSGVAFLLCVADLAALAWARGSVRRRALITLLVLAFIVQTIFSLHNFLIYGRDHYAQIVATMTAEGPTSYGGTGNDFINLSEVEFYAKQQNVTAIYIPDTDLCKTPPIWLIAATHPWETLPPVKLTWPESCQLNFTSIQVFPVWGMSGLTVTLYRRAGSP